MPNYKEQIATETKQVWWRSNRVRVENIYEQVPVVFFDEEQITKVGDEVIKQETVGGLTLTYDPSYTIAIVNPLDDQPTGQTMTLQDGFVMMYSLYKQLAEARDTPPPPPEE